MTLHESLQIFELTDLSNQDENSLKRIYYRLAQRYHPDKGGTFDQFIKLREAYSFLKDAVNNPNFDHTQQDYTNTSDYTSTSGFGSGNSSFHDNPNSDYGFGFDYNRNQGGNDFQDLLNQLNAYKQAYEQARQHVIKYEDVFNSQIKVMNNTNHQLNQMFTEYDHKKDLLEQVFQQEMDKIKRSYERKWWEYILPVNKLTIDQYMSRSNSLIEEYNHMLEKYDDELMNSILKTYQQNYQEMMNLLEF